MTGTDTATRAIAKAGHVDPMEFLYAAPPSPIDSLSADEDVSRSSAPFGAPSTAMSDLLLDAAFLLTGLAFLGGCAGYAVLCERL